jgi:hypothetical protein
VPFKVELTERLIKHLRGQYDAVAEQTEQIVSDVSYAGDEGGIVCHMVQSEEKEALVVSLTQVGCRDLCRSLRQSPITTTIV